jgi:NDP-sugar pyrophosphorylase family protein
MLSNAIDPFHLQGEMWFGILKEHNDQYGAEKEIRWIFYQEDWAPHIVIIPEKTKGPADTVYQVCKALDMVKDDGPFFVKDCDSFFRHRLMRGNYICTAKVSSYRTIDELAAKSFVRTDNHGIVNDIIEKQVVSDQFCVGGYKFAKRSEFMEAYEAIADTIDEVFVSHVIQYMISRGKIFFTQSVEDYTDVGTIDEWNSYLERF